MPSPKPVHGEGLPLWERFKCNQFPPQPTIYKVGDRVIFTNDYGLEFEMLVVGFSDDTDLYKYGNFIHLIRYGTTGEGSAWWFPHKPSELSPCA